MVHTNRGKRLFIFVFYVCVYLYLCMYFAASGFAPCMGLRVRAVATGGVWGCNTPPDDCSYEQFQVNSGRFAEEIQVNQRKFR